MSIESKPWDGYMEPVRIFGGLYFVGTLPASTHIVDTGDGLVMLDSGYQHSLYLVLYNMARMGLDPKDLKYILHTHGHIDHMGATRALVELTGAKTVIGKADFGAACGKNELSYAKELNMTYIGAFEPDIRLSDGDTLTLGSTVFRAVATPGHTEGAMSYFFDVTEGGETFRAGLHGGMGINTLSREYLTKYSLPFSLRDDFRRSMRRLNEEKVDIFLGNHAPHNHTPEKSARVKAGEKYAFVDPEEWQQYNLWCIENLENMIREENHE